MAPRRGAGSQGESKCAARQHHTYQGPVDGIGPPLPSITATRSPSLFARRLRPSNLAPISIVNDIWWISPSTCDEAWRATVCPQTTPETVPRTTICRPATIPDTCPFSPTITSAPCTSPSISPSTCRMPRLMIFSPWPMILRSLPITDFSPFEGALIDSAFVLVVRSSTLGSTVELRVNMKSPNVNGLAFTKQQAPQ